MADLAKMTVTWTCPSTSSCRYSTGLRLNAIQHGRNIALQMEPDDEDKIREHLKSHVAVIKELWRSLESALGALGYAMDVTVSPGADPDVKPVKDDEPVCRCGHSIQAHKDHRKEWTACFEDLCDCLGYSEDDDETDTRSDADRLEGGDYPW